MTMTDPDNEGPADRTFRKRAPRIDTMRNTITGTRVLLGQIEAELDDLHVLGYERQLGGVDKVKVAGGQRDFALDSHGDKRARDAYRNLADVLLECCETLDAAVTESVRFLRVSASGVRRTPRQVNALELADQIALQAQRAGRGEYTPVRRHPQPGANDALVGLRGEAQRLSVERDQARDAVRLMDHDWPDDKPFPHGLRMLVDRVLGRDE